MRRGVAMDREIEGPRVGREKREEKGTIGREEAEETVKANCGRG